MGDMATQSKVLERNHFELLGMGSRSLYPASLLWHKTTMLPVLRLILSIGGDG
jgi:hypothetical protein